MPTTSSAGGHRFTDTFSHEALLYAGDEGFLAGTVPFVRAGLAAKEPVMVVVSRHKIELLRSALGPAAEAVRFADMAAVGRNPARIIPAWREFVDEHAGGGRRLRGIGEPVGPERRGPELVECARHEALLNVAFAGPPAWSLLCPYDTDALDRAVVERARCTHPILRDGAGRRPSPAFDVQPALDDVPLSEPPARADEVSFGDAPLQPLRGVVAARARRAGLGPQAVADLVLAVNEVATNSLRHGGGRGTLRVWTEADRLVCDVRDDGYLDEPLIGREHPSTERVHGRGLWMVNQLCDLSQLRSSPEGTVVRLHTWLP